MNVQCISYTINIIHTIHAEAFIFVLILFKAGKSPFYLMPFVQYKRFVCNFPYGNATASNEEAQQTFAFFLYKLVPLKTVFWRKVERKNMLQNGRITLCALVWALKWDIFIFCVLQNIGLENNDSDDDNNNNNVKIAVTPMATANTSHIEPSPYNTHRTINLRSFFRSRDLMH